MDCKTARLVWNHPEGLFAGLRAHMPGVMEFLESSVRSYVNGETNPFDQSVKEQVGGGQFFTSHSDGEDPVSQRVHDVLGDVVAKVELERYFTQRFGQPISLGNICCDGCKISDGTLSHEQLLAIQLAAVNTEPDGSRVLV